MRLLRVLLCIMACLPLAAPASARTSPSSRPQIIDSSQAVDINRIRMVDSNFGSFAYDAVTVGPGLEFPKGSGKTAVFAGGLWLAGMSGGQLRAAVVDYGTEYVPGTITGGLPDDRNLPQYKVYKLDRVYGDPAERDAALADYNAGAVPHGAPAVTVLGDGSLDIKGDQMLWAVFNDAEPTGHTHIGGSTLPLGVEVQQTVYAFDRPGALGQVILFEFRLINKSAAEITKMYSALWLDPDLGGYTDDLAGVDVSRALGFCYNATNSDLQYGASPPALGLDLLRGPDNLGLVSFTKYVNGTDPAAVQQTYNYMKGLNADGTLLIDPTTSQVTTFAVPGDPVAGTGWLDSNPGDRRFMLSSGPFTMPAGDEKTIVAAIVVGDGNDRLSSITALRHYDDLLEEAYACNFPYPRAPQLECPGNIVWQPGTVQNIDYTIANPGCEREVFDYTLNGARDWPGFPITGTTEIDGEGSTVITIPVPVPDTVADGANLLELHANLQGADVLADQCQHLLGDAATPALLSLAGVTAEPGWVRVTWYARGAESPTATVYRRDARTDWAARGVVEIGGTGEIVFEDREVAPSSRVAYRVGVVSGGQEVLAGETWVDVPGTLELAIGRVSPNPAAGALTVSLTLPNAAPARLELLDLAGRRVASRELSALGPGVHQIRLQESASLPAGAYVVRLTQGGRSLTTKAVLVR